MSCSCCRAAPCEEMFGAEDARHDMEDYLAKGLGDIESRALAAMPASAADGARVLDVGGGVGAFAAELMKRGAASGEVVELVGAYAPYAARLAERLGLAGRTSFRVHDLLADPEGVDPADVVVMNRVVCCSAEGPALTAVAARLARRALLLTFPRSNVLTRSAAALQRLAFRVLGRRYRAFAWPTEVIVGAAEGQGLRLAAQGRNVLWQYLVMVRPS